MTTKKKPVCDTCNDSHVMMRGDYGPVPCTRSLSAPEPAPTDGEGHAIWDLVIADMRERDAFGREKYGKPLRAGDGRRTLRDAYQEALDLTVYLRRAIYESEGK